MKAYDLLELAGRNLRESKLRNSLTTLGIAVGVASLVAMLSLGIGLQQMANRRLARSGLFDTIVVMSHRDFHGFDRHDHPTGATAAEARVLDENARQQIAKLPDVLEAYPDIRFITQFDFEAKPNLTMVAGLPYSAKDTEAFSSLAGSFFSSPTAPEAIIQKSFAEELLNRVPKPGEPEPNASDLAPQLVGKQLVMHYAERAAPPANATPDQQSYSVISRSQPLKIVGIVDLDPESMRGQAHARVFLPLQLTQELHVMQISDVRDTQRAFSSVPIYLTVTVRVRGPNSVQSVEDTIKKLGFSTFSILDATRGLRRFFAILDVFLGIFGSLALAVASLGIANTLIMAILERRREIGIMKAIGGSDADVQQLFFAEAAAMGVLGGVAGVGLGWLIGRVIDFGTNIYLARQQFPPEHIWSVPWWLVAAAIGFSLLVSLVAGLYPAARAARLDPVQALRYE